MQHHKWNIKYTIVYACKLHCNDIKANNNIRTSRHRKSLPSVNFHLNSCLLWLDYKAESCFIATLYDENDIYSEKILKRNQHSYWIVISITISMHKYTYIDAATMLRTSGLIILFQNKKIIRNQNTNHDTRYECYTLCMA